MQTLTSSRERYKKVKFTFYNLIQIPTKIDSDDSIHGSDSMQLGSVSSDDSEIFVNRRRQRRRRNPFLDDEAELDGQCSDDDNDDNLDADLSDFIDDSDLTENNFGMHKKIEMEINKENLLKFLESQTKRELEQMGLEFVYSHPTDLVK